VASGNKVTYNPDPAQLQTLGMTSWLTRGREFSTELDEFNGKSSPVVQQGGEQRGLVDRHCLQQRIALGDSLSPQRRVSCRSPSLGQLCSRGSISTRAAPSRSTSRTTAIKNMPRSVLRPSTSVSSRRRCATHHGRSLRGEQRPSACGRPSQAPAHPRGSSASCGCCRKRRRAVSGDLQGGLECGLRDNAKSIFKSQLDFQ
jgi:hypothetical protein